ncbi:TauD/TfdA family dioxygenase [Streptomyces sp. bgisy034]|uniref:TauD/TfdA family dioxygenase n=1 Tax=Streptomyces sp. bgisy034 TaxID=3413774 RepID=UPI003EB91CFA
MTAFMLAGVLHEAANARHATFDAVPVDPVAMARDGATAEAVSRYERHGFAIFRLSGSQWNEDTVLGLARSVGLGEPFVPPLYTRAGRAAPSVSRITAPPVASPNGVAHPGFETRDGQDLHCDGTLQEIGEVKSAILLCGAQGLSGGTTTLFNAHGAFAALLARDPEAAQALTAPGVLVRQATINESTEFVESPVFTVQDGLLVCRYCVDTTDRWVLPDGAAAQDVKRGLDFLDNARRIGSPYILRFALDEGQALLLDNTRVSHGRDPYEDDEHHRRLLYRSLHLRHPSVASANREAVRGR